MAQIGDILEKEQKRETERADAQPTDAEQSAQQQTTPPHLLATAREPFHRLPIIILCRPDIYQPLFILIKYEQKTSKTAHSADWRQMGKSRAYGTAYRFRRHRRIGADSRRGWHAAATRPEQRPAHPHPRSSPHVRKTHPKSTTR